MSRVLQRTIQERRARVNVESLIKFNGINQTSQGFANPNLTNTIEINKSFAVSFFLLVIDNGIGGSVFSLSNDNLGTAIVRLWVNCSFVSSGNYELNFSYRARTDSTISRFFLNESLTPNRIYHIVLNYTPSNQVEIFVNTINKTSAYNGVSTNSTINQSGPFVFRIGSLQGGAGTQSFTPSGLGNLAFFNRTLTVQEIRKTHHKGGLLPASTHAPCVAHYPCTEQNGKILNDIVEDYNPAKIAAGLPTLSAYNANLINFTDAEVGIPNQSTNTAWRDFYTKEAITVI